MAIRRTTPALLGLFSVVTLFAHRRMAQAGAFRQAAWYHKRHPTSPMRSLWCEKSCGPKRRLFTGRPYSNTGKVPRAFVERLTEAVCTRREWLKSSSRHFVQ